MATLKEKIIELLINQKILSKEKLGQALELQKKKSLSLREVLLQGGFVDESKLMSVLSESLYIPTLNLSKYRIDKSLAETIPERVARQYCLVPISRIGDTMTVAVVDPLNIFALDDLRFLTGYKVDLVIASEKNILQSIDSIYHSPDNIAELKAEEVKGDISFVESSEGTLELGKLRNQVDAAPIVKLVNLIILEALKRRASDIHIEPEEEDLRVRFRIDGDLADAFSIPKKNQNAVIARLKIISGLDITESRIPQDGRFKAKFTDKEIDFRVSSLPANFGQKLVLRVLDKSALSFGLQQLGFSSSTLALLEEAIAKPYGMMLVTGPTGSGKSTTLYSVLTQLNTPERNIITIEDPVEYQIEGITQVQVNPEIGLTFASGLRSLLRQSPDVVLIGEIRDSETADIAVKAALTGQIVMSTLHTNNAAQVVTRLLDMGAEPFLVASSLIMSSAQRLIRLNCKRCREPYSPSQAFLKNLDFYAKLSASSHGATREANKPEDVFFRGRGCTFCNNTGFYGRLAILEILMINDTIRDMITSGASSDKIEEYAIREQGMRTLRQDAFEKVSSGLTTLEEALRITVEQ